MSAEPLARLLADPPDLPVRDGLPALVAALRQRGAAVVQAPPGTGKTTLVPPAVTGLVGAGARVVVAQPRRVAARAAARRLAALLGEPVGAAVGYTVRGDRRVSPGTRVEVVTTGVLLRRLQRDAELPGVGAVVLDEVHERSLEADLALALLIEVREALRADLLLVAMSATIEAHRTAALLATPPVPVVDVPGSLLPVGRVWSPPGPGVLPLDERGVAPRFLDHVADTVRRAVAEQPGDVLAFVPGVGEVEGVRRRLGAGAPLPTDVVVLGLHGRLPVAEQDLALGPAERRRVVVSTAVAESSLTVPGVRSVVDAGLSREPRTDHRRGLAGLVTVRASRAAADQRAGRAGREAPGTVYRCWSEAEHPHLLAHPEPEIAVADLTGLALELALWGTPEGAGLALLDPPPAAALAAARATLADLGATDAAGALTPRGRAMADVPTDPRLARALLDGVAAVGERRAAEVVALLAEDVRAPGGDLVAALRSLRRGGPGSDSWRASVRRLRASLPPRSERGGRAAGPGAVEDDPLSDDLAVGAVVALAHPDRVARRRDRGGAYLMVGGTGALLPPGGSALAGLAWLAVGDVERRPGARDATIRGAAPLDEVLALDAAAARRSEEDEVVWRDGRVQARRVTRLGAIELGGVPLADPPAAAVAAAVRDGLRRDGLSVLPWSAAARSLRRRMDFLHRAVGAPWPDLSDDALASSVEVWLGPELAGVRGTRDLARVDVLVALRRLLPWPEAGRLDELAPERVTVPGGAAVAVDYAPDQPVLAVRLQECFGWERAPLLAAGRVPLLVHLLSPAGRPLAVTADLDSFWTSAYPGVRAEMRGRYPKHAWPEDPRAAPPSRRRRGRPGEG